MIPLLLLAGAAAGPLYGDTLLAHAMPLAHGAALRMDARGKNGAAIIIGPAVAQGSTVPLSDATGAPIGTVTLAGPRARARRVATWLSRRIYVADNLAEPDPFVPGGVRFPRAQALVERMLDANPDLLTLALHVARPGAANTIIASSFGRIGKPADGDDLHVERDGATLREVTNGGRRLAVELPLLDGAGHAIGALSTSFAVPEGADPQSVASRATAVRNQIARSIASLAELTAR